MIYQFTQLLIVWFCDTKITAVLVGIEKAKFIGPMLHGEVIELHGQVELTSKHSLLISVSAFANNLLKGE